MVLPLDQNHMDKNVTLAEKEQCSKMADIRSKIMKKMHSSKHYKNLKYYHMYNKKQE